MRHKVFGRKLGRDINSRKALLRNLSSSILLSGHVVTTEAKAKFVRGYLEKLIRNTQKNSLVNYRDAASVLSASALKKLVLEIAPGMEGRNGGYTPITKLNTRRGDAAPMAKLEILPLSSFPPASTSRRRGERKRESKPREELKIKPAIKKAVTKTNENK